MQILIQKMVAVLAAVLLLFCVPVFADAAPVSPESSQEIGDFNGFVVSLYSLVQQETETLSFDELALQACDFAAANGFNRIFLDCSAQEKPQLFRKVRVGEKEENDFYRLVSRFAKLSSEKGLPVSLFIDPYTIGAESQSFSFLYSIARQGSEIATLENGQLRLDASYRQNQLLAQYHLQKILAVAFEIDSIVLPNDAFFSLTGSNAQLPQAQRMALYLQEISGSLPVWMMFEPPDCILKKDAESRVPLSVDTVAENALANVFLPVFSAADNTAGEKYLDWLKGWENAAENTELIPIVSGNLQSAPDAVFDTLFYHKGTDLPSCVLWDFSFQPTHTDTTYYLLQTLTIKENLWLPQGYSLWVPQKFEITRPSTALTISSSSYFVTGTSDPTLPLYYGDSLVERTTTNGCFGVYVKDIPVGTTNYSFRQGGQSKTVTITRTAPSTTPVPITKIVQSSMYPYYEEALRAGQTINFKCTAPSGASVTAVFGGSRIRLVQGAAANKGIPATFSGSMKMPDLSAKFPELSDRIADAGKVTYEMTYNGVTTSVSSTGQLCFIGKDASFAVAGTDYINNVYHDVSVTDEFYMTLFEGACDYVEEVTNSYYKLRSGGYLPKSTAEIVKDRANVDSPIQGIVFEKEKSGEKWTIVGNNRVPYQGEMTETSLVVKLWNTSGAEQMNPQLQDSQMFADLQIEVSEDNVATLTFQLAEGQKLWGYSIEYGEDGSVVIFAKKPPEISDIPGKPLSGTVVVIDAGHGGEDPGALGIAGTTGPAEREFNYINAYAASQVLKSLGATVHMVNEQDERLDFKERMEPARQLRADFFLSFHHNSTNESYDSSKAKGMEVYYHEEQSKRFAENALLCITSTNKRAARGFYQDYYRVTRMTYAPSLLLELGFVVNPEEYEDLCNPLRIYQTSFGVAKAVLKTIEQS